MNLLFTICGRAGSKGFKNKNIKDFIGYPLVYYSIAVIKLFIEKNSDKYDIDVVLNTDSAELKELVKLQKSIQVDVIDREERLGGDTVAKVSVIKDCLFKISKKYNKHYDMVVDLDITSPLRTLEDVENAVLKKMEREDVRVVFSVTNSRRNPYFNMVREKNGFIVKAIAGKYTTRQQAPVFYDMNASIYVYSAKALTECVDDASFFNEQCDAIVMRDTAVLDIDSEEDFELMQIIGEYLYSKEERFDEIKKIVVDMSK